MYAHDAQSWELGTARPSSVRSSPPVSPSSSTRQSLWLGRVSERRRSNLRKKKKTAACRLLPPTSILLCFCPRVFPKTREIRPPPYPSFRSIPGPHIVLLLDVFPSQHVRNPPKIGVRPTTIRELSGAQQELEQGARVDRSRTHPAAASQAFVGVLSAVTRYIPVAELFFLSTTPTLI